MSGAAPKSPSPSKAHIRSRVLAARRARPLPDRQRAGQLIGERVLGLPEIAAAATVAAYSSLAGEPDTGPLISTLHSGGVAVLLPVLQTDRSLQWARYQPGRQRINQHGIAEPPADLSDEPLLSTATVVLCPGLAGDPHGHRLGRGGGSYDRALAGLDAAILRCLLLYDDEVLDDVPTQSHDQPVDVLVTPTRTIRVSQQGQASRHARRPPRRRCD